MSQFVIRYVSFVVAIRNFIKGNRDKIQALYGILDSQRYGIDRKMTAIADILGISTNDMPGVANRHLGINAVLTRQLIICYLEAAMDSGWIRLTSQAEWVRIRRIQLREGLLPGSSLTPKWIWEQLQSAKAELAKIVS